ncbi:hypothetical protein ACIGEP_16660 [Microbacterium sp. NPDC077663]|uniref:hypothetical protein n=1 Tax=Microbacterium sp. NPDC077663 TaxID=3364189 RepID=UPI0037CBE7F9
MFVLVRSKSGCPLARGAKGQRLLPSVGSVARLEKLRFNLADEPGELARVFAAVELAGARVFEARLDHLQHRVAGTLEILREQAHVPAVLAAVGGHRAA